MDMNEKVLALNLENLSQKDLDWLHELKNKAAAMSGWLQLKSIKAETEASMTCKICGRIVPKAELFHKDYGAQMRNFCSVECEEVAEAIQEAERRAAA